MTFRSTALASLLALAALGCGFVDPEPAERPTVAFARAAGADVASSGRRWSGYAPTLDASGLEADLHGTRYRVAPDRALVRVDLRVSEPTRAGAVARLRATAGRLTALFDDAACSARVAGLGVPAPAGDAWAATGTVRLDVPLRETPDVGERLARVERCLGVFDRLGARFQDVDLTVSAPLPTIDHPEAHRAVLLRRELAALEDVAATEGPAAFDPDGMRCVSRGAVQITERTLAGIALSVDLECAPRAAAAAVAGATAPHVDAT